VKKPLDKIKHGTKIVNAMPEEELFFVEDIKRVTGLDDKTLRQVVNSLLKNGYLYRNEHGMLYREYEAA
jgi:predicted transcriptional regulator of viral defense system